MDPATVPQGWDRFLNRLATLSLAGVAAGLSATVFRADLVPAQIAWLGSLGTLLCISLLPFCYFERELLKEKRIRRALSGALLFACLGLVVLRSSFVVPNTVNGTTSIYLVGFELNQHGRDAKAKCQSETDEELLTCAGTDRIPALYGSSFTIARAIYLADYIMLFAAFIALISVLELQQPSEAQP